MKSKIWCRYFLKCLLIGIFIFSLNFSNNNAFAETRWLCGTLSSSKSYTAIGARKFAELVKTKTKGDIDIQVFDACQLGNGPEQIEAVAIGTQHVFVSAGSFASNLVKEYGVVDVAFLFDSQEHFKKFMKSEMVKKIDDKLVKEFKVRVIASNWFSLPRYFMHRKKFILKPEDIKGERVRTANLPMYMTNWKIIGAVPVKVVYGEQYLALSQGMVDMTESAGCRILRMKLHEVAPYITDAEMMYPQNSVFVNEEAFRSLSPKQKRIVTESAEEAGDYMSKLSRDNFEEEKKTVIKEGGKFSPMPKETRDAFVKMVRDSVPELEANGLIPKGWFHKIRALAD